MKIKPGTWIIAGCYGEAVCLSEKEGWVVFRYEATRCSDGKTIWTQNGVPKGECLFLREPDEISQHVLTLEGPYGEVPLKTPTLVD